MQRRTSLQRLQVEQSLQSVKLPSAIAAFVGLDWTGKRNDRPVSYVSI